MIKKYKIVDIPVKMERYFGEGKMLHPTMEQIEELLKKIPVGSLTTIDELAKKMASEAGTDVTCPMRTGNILKKISERYSNYTIDRDLPFWRVLRKDKLVIKSKNYEFSASLIEDEGFELVYTKSGAIKIDVEEDLIFTF